MAEPGEKFQISLAQVLASSLAAVSAAVVCSFFGVAGTVIGTAVASLFATVGSALYSYSLRRTKERLRRLHRAGAASPPVAEVLTTMREQGRHLLDRVQWAAIGIGTGAVFVFALGIVSVIQDSTNLSGAPLRPHHKAHKQHPTPVPTVTITETSTATPSVTPTPTSSKHATSTPKPTHSASGTPKPSVTPTATSQPSQTPTLAPTSSPSPTLVAQNTR